MEDQKPSQVAIVPSPGMGHLIPLVEFSKRLVVHHNFTVTFIIPNDGSAMEYPKKLLQSLPKPISSIFLPHASFDDLPADAVIETRITLSVTRSLPAIRQSLKAMAESTRLVALVVDMFGLDAFDVAKELNILPYVFYPCNALSLSFVFNLPKLDETTTCEYRDLPEPVKLLGCVPIQGRDLMNPVQDRKSPFYRAVLNMVKQLHNATGLILNTFVDLEPGALKALKEGFYNNPPVYPIGPVVQTGSSGFDECLGWLDKQPQGVKVNDKGLVGREEVVGCVRELMGGELEGKLIRERMRELKEKASLALSEQGSSTKSLAEVAQMWVNNSLNS
ncbi:hypothetical protein TIFTF001_003359 [Ficus carica]|uniref:Uncharacterized protein n=1 Tax=Ficus carica TaxID=3494 RepID=A0AA87Z8S6_FICCA|nr:hypothetical protein TIFTF001_003359 [Ficus carica]